MLTSLALLALGQTSSFSGPQIVITVQKRGTIVIATDAKTSPKTVAQITSLVKKKFYDNQTFHRVEPWVIQWGDPASKTVDNPEVGSGGSGKNMPFEASKVSFDRGIVGIASTGMKTGGDSQIFILVKPAPHLNGNYAVLGKVISGMDVVDKIQRNDRIVSIRLKVPAKKKR